MPVPLSAATIPPDELAGAAVAMDRALAQKPDRNNFGFVVYDWRQKTAAQRAKELARG